MGGARVLVALWQLVAISKNAATTRENCGKVVEMWKK